MRARADRLPPTSSAPASHSGVETGASYWHMVDLVWLILFPLVYVMR